MYPLPVILVRCDQSLRPDVRLELLKQHARVEAEYPDVARAVDRTRLASEWTGTTAAPDGKRLFLLHLKLAAELKELKQLRATFVVDPILVMLDAGSTAAAKSFVSPRSKSSQISYSRLPMIYCSVIHRDLLEALRQKTGRIFQSVSPDVYSAFAFAHVAGARQSSRPPAA